MKRSTDRILTTHAGSLPRLDDLTAAHAAAEAGEASEVSAVLTDAVSETVRIQDEIGISVPGDGELGKASSSAIDYGAWWSYCFQRLGGLELREGFGWITRDVQSGPGDVRTTGFGHRRDRGRFEQAYADPTSGVFAGGAPKPYPTAVSPVTYTGQDAIAADIRNFQAGLDANGYSEGFITSIAPGSVVRIDNDFYGTDEEFVWAAADAMREEYKAIIDAGLILQIDDPSLAENWDQITPEPALDDYLAFSRLRVEALNHALRDLPEDRIRYHLCWGSWHGPHTTDLPMKDIVELMLEVNAGAYSFEAGNVRHEHEWKVWQDVKLPEGKLILPGVVSHATNVVEHPELVADRIERFANLVGRENVIASTDCGLGGRIHPQIAWAKLRTLVEGAELASRRLWS